MTLSGAAFREYEENGYALMRNAIEHDAIDRLLHNYLSLVEKFSGRKFDDAHSSEIATFLKEHKDIQGMVYNEIRQPSWLVDFSIAPGILGQLGNSSVRTLRSKRKFHSAPMCRLILPNMRFGFRIIITFEETWIL